MARHSIYTCRACGSEFTRPVTTSNNDKVFCSIACRFWAKVDKSGDCWTWTKAQYHFGYGAFRIAGKNKHAHRVAWELTNGPIPDGLKVLHKCDNPPCVNPSHLFLGTIQDNTDDMMAKGRQVINWENLRKIQLMDKSAAQRAAWARRKAKEKAG